MLPVNVCRVQGRPRKQAECSREAMNSPCHTRQRLHVRTEITWVKEKAEQPMAFLRRKQSMSHLVQPRAQRRALTRRGCGTQVKRKILQKSTTRWARKQMVVYMTPHPLHKG